MTTTTIPFSEAKTHLSRYARQAGVGQSILVLKHHRPAFVIAPPPPGTVEKTQRPGLARGRIHMAPDFDATPGDVIDAFEGQS